MMASEIVHSSAFMNRVQTWRQKAVPAMRGETGSTFNGIR